MKFQSRYLFSAISPEDWDSFHQNGFDTMYKEDISLFTEELKKTYTNKHLVVVWDNAPSHKIKEFHEMKDISFIRLSSYSPELNPVERFFEEIRKSTANEVFPSLDFQENVINEAVASWKHNPRKLSQLTYYPWLKCDINDELSLYCS